MYVCVFVRLCVCVYIQFIELIEQHRLVSAWPIGVSYPFTPQAYRDALAEIRTTPDDKKAELTQSTVDILSHLMTSTTEGLEEKFSLSVGALGMLRANDNGGRCRKGDLFSVPARGEH